jgi:hypothetical protein
MTPKKHTIEDVRAAGYGVGLASGSVEVEALALAEARGQADPEQVSADVEKIGVEVAHAGVAMGLEGSDLEALVRRSLAAALEQTQTARDKTVAFHERALEAAHAMPDTYVVTALGDPDTPDDDVKIYVSCKADGTGWDEGAQEILDGLVKAASS